MWNDIYPPEYDGPADDGEPCDCGCDRDDIADGEPCDCGCDDGWLPDYDPDPETVSSSGPRW